jgi:hypothetical protein
MGAEIQDEIAHTWGELPSFFIENVFDKRNFSAGLVFYRNEIEPKDSGFLSALFGGVLENFKKDMTKNKKGRF